MSTFGIAAASGSLTTIVGLGLAVPAAATSTRIHSPADTIAQPSWSRAC
jgi:hypothetical protein